MASTNLIKLIKIAVVFVIAFSLLVLTGCTAGLFPQFTYQGRLTDENGLPLNGSVKITYRIYNKETGGSALHSEIETVTVNNGNFSSVVGPGGVVGGLTPDDIAQPLWVELEVGNGTYTETLTPRQRLYGAPYAFTLMPGAVISNSFGSAFTTLGVEGIVTIKNKYDGNPSDMAAPALKVEGETGIEVAGRDTEVVGTIYSDLGKTASELHLKSNYDIELFLDHDNNNSSEWFRIAKNGGVTLCTVNVDGDLACIGAKSAVLELDDEQRLMYAIESSEVWLEDFGSATLAAGEVWVAIDPLFAKAVNLEAPYHVFVTPLGDCNGLYIAEKSASGFLVKELGGGTSNISFDFRISAKRIGYENERMELAPGFQDKENEEKEK